MVDTWRSGYLQQASFQIGWNVWWVVELNGVSPWVWTRVLSAKRVHPNHWTTGNVTWTMGLFFFPAFVAPCYKRFSFNWLCFFSFFFFFLFLGWGLGQGKWVVWGKAKSVLSKRKLTEILRLQYLIQSPIVQCEGNYLFKGNQINKYSEMVVFDSWRGSEMALIFIVAQHILCSCCLDVSTKILTAIGCPRNLARSQHPLPL